MFVSFISVLSILGASCFAAGAVPTFEWKKTNSVDSADTHISHHLFEGSVSNSAQTFLSSNLNDIKTTELIHAIADALQKFWAPTQNIDRARTLKMDEIIRQAWLIKDDPATKVNPNVHVYRFFERTLDKDGTLIFRGKITFNFSENKIEVERHSTIKKDDKEEEDIDKDTREVVGTEDDACTYALGLKTEVQISTDSVGKRTLEVRLNQDHKVIQPWKAYAFTGMFNSGVREANTKGITDDLNTTIGLIEAALNESLLKKQQREPQSIHKKRKRFKKMN